MVRGNIENNKFGQPPMRAAFVYHGIETRPYVKVSLEKRIGHR